MLNSKKKNYKIKIIFEYLLIISSFAKRRIIKQFNLEKYFFYPKKIKALYKLIKRPTNNYSNLSIQVLDINEKIYIFDKYIEIKELTDWKIECNDEEEKNLLNRWHWLLINSTNINKKFNYEKGVSLIYSWMLSQGNLKNTPNSYDASERIVNFLLFQNYHQKDLSEIPIIIKNYLFDMAYQIANNLEFNNNDLTGNHLLNNARALLILGLAFKSKNHTDLGIEILKYILSKIIVDKYFLREGSSHYQYLITSWLIEIQIFAKKYKQNKLYDFIKFHVNNMVNGCRFFQINKSNDFVKIGDISPDKTPEWLIGVVEFYEKINLNSDFKVGKSWASVMSVICKDIKFKNNFTKVMFEDSKYFREAGFFRGTYKDWCIFMHIETGCERAIASHAHHDFGSFILFHNKKEILLDPGRYNYTKSNFGRYGKSAISHNTLLVNKYHAGWSKTDRNIPPTIKKKKFQFNHDCTENKLTIILSHNGFLKSKVLNHIRKISINKNTVEIADELKGDGNIESDIYFHWPENILLGNSNSKLHSSKQEGQIRVNIDYPEKTIYDEFNIAFYKKTQSPYLGWQFPSYGVKKPALSQKISIKSDMPLESKFKIYLNKE